MKPRIITLFSGGGLFTQGAVLAGLHPVGAVEWDAKIAKVYADNFGNHIITSAVENINPATWELLPGELDILQASPSCKNLSVANSKKGECYSDLTAALGIVRHLVGLQPKCFVLEQVWGYKDTTSLKMILGCLKHLNYHYVVCKLNAADYGTPQARIRLFVIAVKRELGYASIPPITHTKELSSQGDLFDLLYGEKQKWIGWYEAVKDLLDDLPDSDFANWQYKRLAVLVDEGKLDELVSELSKVSLIDCRNQSSNIPKNDNYPSWTITADGNLSHLPKAILIQRDGTPDNQLRIKDDSHPTSTLMAFEGRNSHQFDALLLSPANTTTQYHQLSGIDRVKFLVSLGRVVTLSDRCLMRLQGVPDTYKLSTNHRLNCVVAGNGVAVPVAQAICSHLLKKIISPH